MVIHKASASGGNGFHRTSACAPLGRVIGGARGARFACSTRNFEVTCRKCNAAIEAAQVAVEAPAAVREAADVVLSRMDNKGEDILAAIESCGFDGDREFSSAIVRFMQGGR